MTEAERQTEQTVSSAQDALAALLAVGVELRFHVDVLAAISGEDGSKIEAEVEVIPTLTHLTESVDALTESTARLADEQEEQRRRIGALGRRGVLLALAAVAVAVLIGGGLLWLQVLRLADQAEQQRAQVMCPFFALIVGSYSPDSRPEGPARQQYEDQFRVMRQIYEQELACPGPPVPPRQTGG